MDIYSRKLNGFKWQDIGNDDKSRFLVLDLVVVPFIEKRSYFTNVLAKLFVIVKWKSTTLEGRLGSYIW